jgi:hypothetical protein
MGVSQGAEAKSRVCVREGKEKGFYRMKTSRATAGAWSTKEMEYSREQRKIRA